MLEQNSRALRHVPNRPLTQTKTRFLKGLGPDILGGMASPAAGTCLDRERLVREFKDANEELVRIHTDEINAAMQGSLSAALSLHDELGMARKRRDRAAEELKHHLKQHGC